MPGKKRPLLAAASGIVAGWRLAPPALVGAAATLLVGVAAVPTADAKSPGTRYCFHGLCYRVGTLAQTDTLVGWRGYVRASYYDSCHHDPLNPCGLTSSGAVFRADRPDNAASPLLPDGTVILAYNPKTGDARVLRINNAGPYSGERKLDVSRAAAEKLGFLKQGTASLVITVLQSPTKSEATYVSQARVPAGSGLRRQVRDRRHRAQDGASVLRLPRGGEQPADDTEGPLEVAALETGSVPQATACRVAIARPRAGDAALAPAAHQSSSRSSWQGPRLVSRGPAACRGPQPCTRSTPREPSRFQGPAATCTSRRDERLLVGSPAVSAGAECARRRQLIGAAPDDPAALRHGRASARMAEAGELGRFCSHGWSRALRAAGWVANPARFPVPCGRTGLQQADFVVEGHALN